MQCTACNPLIALGVQFVTRPGQLYKGPGVSKSFGTVFSRSWFLGLSVSRGVWASTQIRGPRVSFQDVLYRAARGRPAFHHSPASVLHLRGGLVGLRVFMNE